MFVLYGTYHYICIKLNKITQIMALAISTVPVLTVEAAERFEKNMKAKEKQRGSVDFSKQIAEAKKILAKAKLQN